MSAGKRKRRNSEEYAEAKKVERRSESVEEVIMLKSIARICQKGRRVKVKRYRR